MKWLPLLLILPAVLTSCTKDGSNNSDDLKGNGVESAVVSEGYYISDSENDRVSAIAVKTVSGVSKAYWLITDNCTVFGGTNTSYSERKNQHSVSGYTLNQSERVPCRLERTLSAISNNTVQVVSTDKVLNSNTITLNKVTQSQFEARLYSVSESANEFETKEIACAESLGKNCFELDIQTWTAMLPLECALTVDHKSIRVSNYSTGLGTQTKSLQFVITEDADGIKNIIPLNPFLILDLYQIQQEKLATKTRNASPLMAFIYSVKGIYDLTTFSKTFISVENRRDDNRKAFIVKLNAGGEELKSVSSNEPRTMAFSKKVKYIAKDGSIGSTQATVSCAATKSEVPN